MFDGGGNGGGKNREEESLFFSYFSFAPIFRFYYWVHIKWEHAAWHAWLFDIISVHNSLLIRLFARAATNDAYKMNRMHEQAIERAREKERARETERARTKFELKAISIGLFMHRTWQSKHQNIFVFHHFNSCVSCDCLFATVAASISMWSSVFCLFAEELGRSHDRNSRNITNNNKSLSNASEEARTTTTKMGRDYIEGNMNGNGDVVKTNRKIAERNSRTNNEYPSRHTLLVSMKETSNVIESMNDRHIK